MTGNQEAELRNQGFGARPRNVSLKTIDALQVRGNIFASTIMSVMDKLSGHSGKVTTSFIPPTFATTLEEREWLKFRLAQTFRIFGTIHFGVPDNPGQLSSNHSPSGLR